MSKETNHHHDDDERREPNAVDGIRAHEPTHERKRSLPATALDCEGFVQPSSYLRRPRGLSKPMSPAKPPETAVDRDQRRGLVSNIIFCRPAFVRGALIHDVRICVANHQSLSKGPHELRCAPAELPLDRPRHQPVGQEELEYSRTKWQD
jgi:hypothetical protein